MVKLIETILFERENIITNVLPKLICCNYMLGLFWVYVLKLIVIAVIMIYFFYY